MNSRYRKTLTQSLDEVKIRSLYMKGKEKESVEVIAKKLGMQDIFNESNDIQELHERIVRKLMKRI